MIGIYHRKNHWKNHPDCYDSEKVWYVFTEKGAAAHPNLFRALWAVFFGKRRNMADLIREDIEKRERCKSV
jgi:hypothetical protein